MGAAASTPDPSSLPDLVTEAVARDLLGEHFDGERFLAESSFDADLEEEAVPRDRFLHCVMAAAWSDADKAALEEAVSRFTRDDFDSTTKRWKAIAAATNGGKFTFRQCRVMHKRLRHERKEVKAKRKAEAKVDGKAKQPTQEKEEQVKDASDNKRTETKHGHGPSLNNFAVPRSIQPQQQCPSPVPKDQEAWAKANRHINERDLRSKFNRFVAPHEQQKPLPILQRGLSLQFFRDLHETLDINDQFSFLEVLWLVQILTLMADLSLAEMMGDKKDANGQPYRAASNRFVSHATAHTSFEDLAALEAYEAKSGADGGMLFFFIDVFAINQSRVMDDDELPQLEVLIKACQRTVLIFNKWHDPEVVKRIWCLYEIQKTAQHQCQMEVCFSTAQHESFLLALKNQHPEGHTPATVLDSLSRIDAAKAEATQEADRERILADIESSIAGGIAALDDQVKELLRHELVRVMRAAVEGAGEDEDAAMLAFGVGAVFKQALARYDDALAMFTRAREIFERLGNDENAAHALGMMGTVYDDQGKHELAVETLQRALTLLEGLYGKDHIQLAATLGNLGAALSNCGKDAESLAVKQRCLGIFEAKYGEGHAKTAQIVGNIAATHNRMGNLDLALEMAQKALRIQEKAHGVGHIETASAIDTIARVMYAQGDYPAALAMAERCLRIRRAAYGANSNHPEIARAAGLVIDIRAKME